MTGPAATAGPSGPVWTAAAVARRLGVAPATLRSWAQRHGIGPAAHHPGRHRRYTATDVAELDAIRNLLDQGVAISAAAELVRGQRRAHGRDTGPAAASGSPAPTRPDRPPVSVGALAGAAGRLDSESALEIVSVGLDERGVLVAWEELCRPALDELDATVGDGLDCVDAHLLLSWVLVTCLRRRRPIPGRNPVLLACAPGEQHTLGMEALHAALTERRVPTRMLGPDVPAPALAHAAATLHPRAIVVWAQQETHARPDPLSALTTRSTTVLAAGPGWQHCELPAPLIRVDNLPAALALSRSPAPVP